MAKNAFKYWSKIFVCQTQIIQCRRTYTVRHINTAVLDSSFGNEANAAVVLTPETGGLILRSGKNTWFEIR